MTQVTDMRGLMIDCVQDLHAGEMLTVDRLPPIIGAVGSPELRAALADHRAASREQARRLRDVARGMGEQVEGPECLWAKGVLDDARRDTRSVAPGPLLDIALIGAIRKLEAAETMSYQTAIGVARALGMDHAAALLARSQEEEEEAMNATLHDLLIGALSGVAVA